jgi:hypothetical protein
MQATKHSYNIYCQFLLILFVQGLFDVVVSTNFGTPLSYLILIN